MIPSNVKCPLLQREIPNAYCLEICSAVEGLLKKDALKDNITKIKNYEVTCNSCEYHEY